MARNMKAVAERVEQDAVREVKAEGRVYHTPEVYDLGTLAAVQGSGLGYWDYIIGVGLMVILQVDNPLPTSQICLVSKAQTAGG